ncbi:hypothetical protein C8J57DRAFT_1594146 [Mycena rebaudengoi]|nr:hypothetical protein C8J57DRAFT_1594146 [Mycena rebaudengoi]
MSILCDDSPITKCLGTQIGDGCQGDFPNKDFNGLCARCQMLESFKDDPLERAIREEYPQCLECGSAARNFRGEICGSCRRIAKQAAGLEDQALVDAEHQRGLVFQARMNTHKQKKLVPPSFKAITDGTPSHPLTTDSLNRLRQSKNGTLGRMIHVNVLPVMDGKASTWLPTFSEMYHTDKPVMDIIPDILGVMNETWESTTVWRNDASGLLTSDVFPLQKHR